MNTEYQIQYRGFALLALCDTTSEEETVMYFSDNTGHPGAPVEITVNEIWYSDENIIKLLNDEQIEEIEELCYEQHEKEKSY